MSTGSSWSTLEYTNASRPLAEDESGYGRLKTKRCKYIDRYNFDRSCMFAPLNNNS